MANTMQASHWLEEEKPAVTVPVGLPELLLDFAKATLKAQPAELTEFARDYFTAYKEKACIAAATTEAPARPLQVIICGAPASGKGTQAARISGEWGLVHVSVGDLLRAEAAVGSELGCQAQECMEQGALVPDDLVVALVRERLAREDARQRGWLLDGFPRTQAQCEALASAGLRADLFLCIEVQNNEVLVDRVVGRRVDPETGDIWHLTLKPPPADVAGRLVQRADDTEETVRARILAYKAHLAAVRAAFSGKETVVDGDRPEAAVWEDVQAALWRAAKAASTAAIAHGTAVA